MSKLKIKIEHQNMIKESFKTFLELHHIAIIDHVKELRVQVIQGKVKDIKKRLCWDMFYYYSRYMKSKQSDIVYEFTQAIKPYANDDNIYSFLKTIVPYKAYLS